MTCKEWQVVNAQGRSGYGEVEWGRVRGVGIVRWMRRKCMYLWAWCSFSPLGIWFRRWHARYPSQMRNDELDYQYLSRWLITLRAESYYTMNWRSGIHRILCPAWSDGTMWVSPEPAHGVRSDRRPEALLQLDGESDRRRRMELGHCFWDAGVLVSKDVPDSHDPLATHSPMRGMSKEFKEGQESSCEQATPAPCGRHSLRTKVKNEEGEQSPPYQQRVGAQEKCLLFPRL